MADRMEAPSDGTARAVVVMAAGWGLAAGLLEVVALVVQDAIDPKVTVESIRTNHHYPWMIPLSTATLFVAVGLVLGLIALRWPRVATRSTPIVLGVPLFLGPLLAIRGLYPIVSVLLAIGLAVRLAPLVRLENPRTRRAMRAAVPILAGVVALVGVTRASFLANQAAGPKDVAIASPREPKRPNVLLVVMDTVRADHVSLYGYGRATMPNLDRWAKRGVVFTGARSTAPWTLPSHASMLTGRWPHELSADVDHPLDATYPTLASVLADRGYATGGFVANTYYCNAWYGLDRGFGRYEDFPENVQVSIAEVIRSSKLGRKLIHKLGYKEEKPGEKGSRKSAATINRDALAWISGLEGEPFFAFLNYYDAHGPFEPPDDHAWRFGPGTTDPSKRVATFSQVDVNAVDAPGGGENDGAASGRGRRPKGQPVARLVDAYDECIASIDEQLGNLLDGLDGRGLLDDTLVIITSDHGEHFGDRGLFGHGHSLYAPLIDVPLLVLAPRGHRIGSEGLRVVDPVSLRDIPATVADILGVDFPFPGRSLARLWEPDASATTRLAEIPLSEVEQQKKFPPSPHVPASTGPLWSLVEGTLVYIRDSHGQEQLYDRATDPSEMVNLAELPARKAELDRLRTALEIFLRPNQVEPRTAGPAIATRPGEIHR